MNDSPYSQVLDLHVDEEPIRARDVRYGAMVRPACWYGYQPVLGVEPLRGNYVRVLWRCDPGDEPPGPYTVFAADEWLAVMSR